MLTMQNKPVWLHFQTSNIIQYKSNVIIASIPFLIFIQKCFHKFDSSYMLSCFCEVPCESTERVMKQKKYYWEKN